MSLFKDFISNAIEGLVWFGMMAGIALAAICYLIYKLIGWVV